MLPYLLLCRKDAGQREHDLRVVFIAVRYMDRSGCSWRLAPNDLPLWAAVYQQFRRWLEAGVFVVVYKLDRPTRISRRLREDRGSLQKQRHQLRLSHQAVNTTSSMGRLILNVLLSFA